jgi:hypothetical protein
MNPARIMRLIQRSNRVFRPEGRPETMHSRLPFCRMAPRRRSALRSIRAESRLMVQHCLDEDRHPHHDPTRAHRCVPLSHDRIALLYEIVGEGTGEGKSQLRKKDQGPGTLGKRLDDAGAEFPHPGPLPFRAWLRARREREREIRLGCAGSPVAPRRRSALRSARAASQMIGQHWPGEDCHP